MAADEFKPKLGRIRSVSGRKNQKYLNHIVRDIRRTSQPRSRTGRSTFFGSRSGRGYSVAASQRVRSFQPGRRRVIIKARFTKIKSGDLGAARAHLRYIQRDGVTREGKPGELYGQDNDRVDGKTFLEGTEDDRHQFRFIVAPEDSAQFEDLKPFIRDLMQQAESDLGTKLEWVAVDHFNTGHPHTHIVVRGKVEKGGDLIIARDYLSHGLRERARGLITLELGPETKHELDQKIEQEVQSERFTRIDRTLLRDADLGILTISNSPNQNRQWHSQRIGRLRKLESMGLAKELQHGVWKFAERTESVLQQLGQRGDIMKTMQAVLKEAGIDRGASDYSVFDASQSSKKITGKLVALGLSDEFNDRHYAVVDGMDGKLHYAEIGRLSKYDPPSKDMVVTLRGQNPIKQRQSQQTIARVFIDSHVPFRNLASADGATWLDRKLLSKKPLEFRNKGFGAESNRALRLRQQPSRSRMCRCQPCNAAWKPWNCVENAQ
ncbi:MAG: relaxase/mobilization nuclease domain-containing protein [Planctomycetaceae bacterium]|nr:relaxase/mobilization nuclease domain-containing protein [Planctomycetaceae bacterium]